MLFQRFSSGSRMQCWGCPQTFGHVKSLQKFGRFKDTRSDGGSLFYRFLPCHPLHPSPLHPCTPHPPRVGLLLHSSRPSFEACRGEEEEEGWSALKRIKPAGAGQEEDLHRRVVRINRRGSVRSHRRERTLRTWVRLWGAGWQTREQNTASW